MCINAGYCPFRIYSGNHTPLTHARPIEAHKPAFNNLMYFVNLSANSLREDYKFHHTFSTEIAKFLKVSTGKLVLMQPEKFQSKYEPRSNVMDVQVSENSSGMGACCAVLTPGHYMHRRLD